MTSRAGVNQRSHPDDVLSCVRCGKGIYDGENVVNVVGQLKKGVLEYESLYHPVPDDKDDELLPFKFHEACYNDGSTHTCARQTHIIVYIGILLHLIPPILLHGNPSVFSAKKSRMLSPTVSWASAVVSVPVPTVS